MKLLFFIFCMLLTFSLSPVSTFPTKALTQVPVADLVGNSSQNHKQLFTYYNNLPLCGQRSADCHRVHQLLYNEIVTILEQKGDEVLVQIPMLFFELENSTQRHDTYWTLKKNFITFDELERLGISRDYFPEPIYYENPTKKKVQKIIALILPFRDVASNQLFSVGTRFVVDTKKKIRTNHSVFIFDPAKKIITTVDIPIALCRVENVAESYQKKVNDFIKILRSWASVKGIIPYVWGGCSFTEKIGTDHFELIKKSDGTRNCSYYVRSECKGHPKTGFDCTGLIARVAQICGIPYYFKNSTTVMKYLKPPTEFQNLVEGDLIWIPGHIMVIANKVKNSIIEARAYNHGFGKVQEILLKDVFKGINSFEQLHQACKNNQPLERLNNQGRVVQTIATYKLLKLDSLWQHNN